MWLKKHWYIFLRLLVIMLLLVITSIPITHRALSENRIFRAIDAASTQYINDALARAASAYALSRSFNALVSVFEESHLQLEPAGVGVSLALGEILDPINDLVERFSWVMLISLTALGIQKALVIVGPWFSLNILLPLALVLLLLGSFPFEPWTTRFRTLGNSIMLSLILVRFAVPAMAYLNQQVYISVLEKTHDEAVGKVNQEMGKIQAEMPNLEQFSPPPSSSSKSHRPQNLWDKTKEALNRTLDQSKEMGSIQNKVNKIKDISTGLIDRLIDLTVVFVLNTIVLPLLFFWAIAKLGKRIMSSPPAY